MTWPAPRGVPPSKSVPCLARLLAVWHRRALGLVSAESSIPLARWPRIPATSRLFPPFDSVLFSSLTSPSLCPPRTTLVLCFVFHSFASSAHWIRLSLFQGHPPRSFLLVAVSPFLATFLTPTPFGTCSTRVHSRQSAIHSFAAQASHPLVLQHTNPTNSTYTSSPKIVGIYSRLHTSNILDIPIATS